MKRLFDFFFACSLLLILALPMIYFGLRVRASSPGPILYWSSRIGKNNEIFNMPKFRTMYLQTPEVATDLLSNIDTHLTPLGRWMRQTSLDELPQLYSIILGHMSFVGPRPALHNQHALIEMRTKRNIHSLRPGLTGLAQVHGRDEVSMKEKVQLDFEYLNKHTFWLDLIILLRTAYKVLRRDGISH